MPDTQGISVGLLDTFFIGWTVILDEFNTGLTVRGSQEYNGCFNTLKPNERIQPRAFQFVFALHFQSQINKKRFSGSKIIYVDTHMIYFIDFHIIYLILLVTVWPSHHPTDCPRRPESSCLFRARC